MKWNKLITTKRFGMENYYQGNHDGRTEFQRDYDRLIFSPAFRRLQNKTQVFPLPGSVFVHNRLTHSLEVSCVGRSIGNNVGRELSVKYPELASELSEIGAIVAAACLAHDLGNPPFGHSGENAIGTFFSEGKGVEYRNRLNISEAQWADLTTFEGNANAFRILTHQFEGRREGGFVLTYPTLASIVKYPYESRFADKKKQKFGFFQSEVASYERIAEDLGIIRNPMNADRYARYPLVYLVEAADDICYQMMDIEDAYKLRLLTFDETKDLLMRYLPQKRRERAENEVFKIVSDENEQISYLRSSVVGVLIDGVSKVFIENEESILKGEFQGALIDHLPEELREAYKHSSKVSVKKIYRAQMVLDIELAGYKIISELLDILMKAVFEPEKAYSKQFLSRIPQQYNVAAESDYEKVQSILDYISGMTDVYALDLYRKINGMSLPTI